MIIERIEIENFRSLKDIDIGCDDLTAIIGRNGTGKSTLLYALDVFYNVAAHVTEYDYFAKDSDKDIKIRVTYSQLREDEKNEFSKHLKDSKLTVTKVINKGGARYYGASKQLPEFNEIRKLAATPKRKTFNELVDSGKFPDLKTKAASAAAVDEAMELFEGSHPELLGIFETEQQFLGARNIGGGKLDNFTKFVLIPAVRDASAETEKKGVILQLIDVLVARSINKRPDVRALNQEFEKRVKEVYNPDNLAELGKLAGLITKLLAQYAPGAELDLAFGDIVPPKISMPPAIATLVEDNFKCPISYTGHGLQRALIFALLQQLSITDMSPEVPEPEGEIVETDTGKKSQEGVLRIPDLILGIEEPELYLHPSRSRYLSEVMLKLSTPSADLTAPRTQIMYATHSPYFIDLERFDRIRLAKKVKADGHDVLKCQLTQYSRQAAAQQLAEISGKAPDTFTADSFVAHASSVMTSVVNEGFFADVVVVVEGSGDAGILWATQEILGKHWDGLGIVVVPAIGKNNIDRPVVIFRGLKIPTYFLFDGDSRHAGSAKEEKTIKSNEILLKLAGVRPVNFPDTQVHNTWAVFKDEIETELKVIGNGVFEEIRNEVADKLGYDRPNAVLKNPVSAAQFIKYVYDKGHKIQCLEDIVNRITDLKSM